MPWRQADSPTNLSNSRLVWLLHICFWAANWARLVSSLSSIASFTDWRSCDTKDAYLAWLKLTRIRFSQKSPKTPIVPQVHGGGANSEIPVISREWWPVRKGLLRAPALSSGVMGTEGQ